MADLRTALARLSPDFAAMAETIEREINRPFSYTGYEGDTSRVPQRTIATSEERVPLPDDLLPWTTVLARDIFPEAKSITSTARPLITYAVYYNPSGILAGLETFAGTTKIKSRRFSDLLVEGEHLREMIGSGKDVVIPCNNILILINNPQYFFNGCVKKTIDPMIIPDIILRRAHNLLFNRNTIHEISQDIPPNCVRKGVVFETIRQAEVISTVRATDVVDAPVERVPYTPPGLSQDDINNISLMARHYSQYCFERHLPVKWPKSGNWPDWPEDFLIFKKPQRKEIRFSWWPGREGNVNAPFPANG